MRDLSVFLKSDYVPDGVVTKCRITLYRNTGRREMYGDLVNLSGRDLDRGEQITFFTELAPGPYILQAELLDNAHEMKNIQRIEFTMADTSYALQFEFPRPRVVLPTPVVPPIDLPR